MRTILVAALCVGFLGCNFGIQTCTEDSQCGAGNVCVEGFCAKTDGGTGGGGGTVMGGGTGGGGAIGGGGGGGGGGGAPLPFCRSGFVCPQPYEECAPTLDGGVCTSSDLRITWVSPLDGDAFQNSSVPATLRVTKADGGQVELTLVPVAGAQNDFAGAMGTYSGQLLLGGLDGSKTFIAGWQGLGLPNASLTLIKDTAAPGVELFVEPRPGSLPDSESGFTGYWKKDEAATLRVTVDGGRAAQASDIVTSWGALASTSSACTGSCVGNCRCFQVDLATAPVMGMRAAPELQVGRIDDGAGNRSDAQNGVVQVTRFKWARPLAGAASRLLAVAVSRDGLVVAGVETLASTGEPVRLVTYAQDGGTKWVGAGIATGAVTAGPVVGVGDLWVATNTGVSSQFLRIGLSSGAPAALGDCIGGNVFGGDMALSILSVGTEIPLGVRNGEVQGPVDNGCRQLPLSPAPSNLLARPTLAIRTPGGTSTEVFTANEGQSRLWKAELSGTQWTRLGWAPLPSGTQPRGLFFDGVGNVGGGGGGIVGNGALFATDAGPALASDGGTRFASVLSANAGQPALGSNYLVYGNSDGDLVRIPYGAGDFTGAAVTVPAGAGDLQTAMPVIGAGGLIYAVGLNGRLTVRSATDLSEAWFAPLGIPGAGSVSQSALDVYRGANGAKDCTKPLGVLYVTTRVGAAATLRAILVDSKGLDRTAPWPKYQRDNANTGNIDLSKDFWTCTP